MTLPPPWYFLLIGATLLAFPFVQWRAAADARRRNMGLFAAFATLEVALILLFYSKLVCWLLAGGASAMLAAMGDVRRPRRGALVAAIGSLMFGLLFQFLPFPLSFVSYFSFGLPIMIGLPLVWLFARDLRYVGGTGAALASGGVIAFGALIATSAYALDFLQRFEVAHLAVLVLTAAGLGWWGRVGGRVAREARGEAVASMDVGAYVGRPAVRSARVGHAVVTVALASSAALFGSYAFGLRLLLVVALVNLLGMLFAIQGRPTQMRLVAPFLSFVTALTVASTAGSARLVGDIGGRGIVALLLGGIAAVVAALDLALSLATVLDRRDRESLVAAGTGPFELPRAAVVVQGQANVGELEALAASLPPGGAVLGVLVVSASDDPLWTVPDDVYDWLTEQAGVSRVHVAIEDADGLHLVPPIVPEETG